MRILMSMSMPIKTDLVLMYTYKYAIPVFCDSQGFPGFPGNKGRKGEKGNLFMMNIKGETSTTMLMQCFV